MAQSLCSSLLEAEEEYLQLRGFVVKNTFIDDLAPAARDDRAPKLKRAFTSPLPKLWPAGESLPESEWVCTGEPDCAAAACADVMDVMGVPSGSAIAIDAMSEASTCLGLPDVFHLDSAASDAMSVQGEEETTLSLLVKRECGFLRIASAFMVPLEPAQSAKLPVRNVTQCLRVCVRGLPGLKRMKWQQPLAWSIALTLQRVGCMAFVKRGQLYAPLDASNLSDGEVVRVDLCAPRIFEC